MSTISPTINQAYFERACLVLNGNGRPDKLSFVNGPNSYFPTVVANDGEYFSARFDVISGLGGRPLTGQFELKGAGAAADWPTVSANFDCNGDSYSVNLSQSNGKLILSTQFSPQPISLANRLASLMLRAVYCVCRSFVASRRRRILFTSESRSSLSGNMQFVYEQLQSTPNLKINTYFCRPGNLIDYIVCTAKMAGCNTLVTDDYHPVLYRYPLPQSVRVFQLWHACGAFKTVGYSRAGKDGCPRIGGRAHRCYTHVAVSSEQTRVFYSEAFGIPIDNLYATGVPRTDSLLESSAAQRAEALLKSIADTPSGARIILFAPTFRGDGAASAHYPYELIDFERLYTMCTDTNSAIIFKMHPFVKWPPPIPNKYRDRLFDASTLREVNDILAAVDAVVTDYSSIIYEASLLAKPMLFYTFDLEEYTRTRDFYEPFDTFIPGQRCDTFDQLLSALSGSLSNELSVVFRDANFSHTDGHSTERVAQLILSGI